MIIDASVFTSFLKGLGAGDWGLEAVGLRLVCGGWWLWQGREIGSCSWTRGQGLELVGLKAWVDGWWLRFGGLGSAVDRVGGYL
jgi:hypothetical protein|eukprot:CAMPEP_0174295746 /NCGR_PEP_ID=MMETSP0809-20121228/45736_1 /TAXON_ID=73025 ORGANISM="Eutreptiella gymnastica-like, Strain CCMP1594" /NCGR_SAMPLE_ID=MMETSP0809 /ASSEMBLY_ACC=CAM_ASM_000658 /LENGTH=83 /DNA_ID=CAMNT_0015398265 /DNA_START=1078 /DNA_END=1329 /DNA_ORIENTATION=+